MKTRPRVYQFPIKKNKKNREKVHKLRGNGLTIRQIAPLVNMSHEWVRTVINEGVEKSVEKSS